MTIKVHIDNRHSVGLGDNLCLISGLASIPEKVEISTTNDHNTYDRLTHYCKIFQIPESCLEIVKSNTTGNSTNHGWPIKLFTDYYKPEFVSVNDQLLKTNTDTDKRFVAIAGFFDKMPSEHNNQWPWCKHRPLEYWAKIFAWIKSMDYEVITIDRHAFDLESKIEFLVKNCRAVVSYEGGMAHLAHMLQIPCFLIDWKYPSPSTVLQDLHCDFVHMASSVYIVRDDQELFNWNVHDFDHTVGTLKQGNTNNKLMSKSYFFKFTDNNIRKDISVFDHDNNLILTVPSMFGDNPISALISTHYLQ